MFPKPFENDCATADTDQSPFHWRKAAALEPWSCQIPVLWAEEEQEDEDRKTTRDVEAEKQMDKKRDRQGDKPRPSPPPKNPKPRKKVR